MTAELDYLNEENGRLRRAVETYKAELALRIAEIDSLNIDKGHMRAEVERLTALEEATRKANLDCMDHYNEVLADWKEATAKNRELQAEVERLKAQEQEPVAWLISSKDWWPESVAVTQKPTGLLGNETLQPLYLAPGAAPKGEQALQAAREAIHDVFELLDDSSHVNRKLTIADLRNALALIDAALASGAAPKENT